MKKSDTSHQWRVLVVGDSCDEFIRFVIGVLSDYTVDFEHVSDVYQAMGRLARSDFKDGLVVGRLEELGREDGRFFEKISEMSLKCCCFTAAVFSKQSERFLNAGEWCVSIMTELEQFERIIIELFTNGSILSVNKKLRGRLDFNSQQFITTEAERKALLEQVD